MKDKQIVVDGLVTTYTQVGEGPLILMLHGWGDNRKTFNAFMRYFADSNCVVALDLPGFGQTQKPNNAWDLDGYATFVASFLSKIKQEKVNVIIGHSNGAAIAIRGIAEGIIDANKLVLIAASGIRVDKNVKRFSFAAAAKVGKAATSTLPWGLRERLQKRMYKLAGSDALVAPELKESFKKIVRQDVRDDARKLHLPTLITYGDDDTATPPVHGALYHDLIADSTFEIIPESGHFLHQDNANTLAKYIKNFIV